MSPATRMDAAMVAYTKWIIRWRWLVLALTLVGAAVGLYGFRYFTLNDDYRVFFREEDPRLQALEAVQDTYTNDDNILFVVTAQKGEVFEQRVLEAVGFLTEQSWELPFAIRVDSLTNYQYSWAEDDDINIDALIPDPSTMTESDFAKAKQIALAEPMLVNRLVKPGSAVTGVNVAMQLPEDRKGVEGQCVRAAKELIAKTEAQFPEVKIGMTGLIPLNNSFLEATKQDLRTLIPVMLFIIILSMAYLLQSFSLMIVTVAVISLSAACAVGMTCFLGYEISGPMVPAPLMILTLAVADSIHILVTLVFHMRHGHSKEAALVESMRLNIQPVFLTSLTTCFGFLSMNLIAIPPIAMMGNMTAFGITLAFMLSVAFLPAFVAVLPVRLRGKVGVSVRQPFIEHLAGWVIRYRRSLLWGFVIVSILTGVFIPRIPINNQFIEYFNKDIPIRRDTEYAMEHLTGIYTLTYNLEAADSGGVSEPEYLERLDAFSQWMLQQKGVVHVSSFSDVMKRLNKNMHGDDPAMFTTPDSRELAAQYLLLYEMSLPQGLDLNTQVNIDKSATRVVVTTENLRSEQLLELGLKGEAWLAENTPEYMHSQPLGPGVLFAYIARTMIHSMLVSTPMALILVSISLLIALRSIKFGLLSLIPNLMPLAMGFGIWGVMQRDMNFSMSSITAMGIGIVVDETVHFLSKYLRARREKGLGVEDAVRYAYSSVGKAMWVTTFVLVAGFSVMNLSSFQYSQNLGLLTGMVIVFAFACDLIFLPALLLYTDVKDRAGSKTLEEMLDEDEAMFQDA